MMTLKVTHTFPKGIAMTAGLTALLANKAAMNATVEVAAAHAVKRHLTGKYAGTVNKLGGVSTGYWKKAIEGTSSSSNAEGATVVISQVGIKLKYSGGTIRASGRTSEVTGKPTKFLTIPVHPAAHGKTISDLGGKSAFYLVPFAAGGGFSEEGTGGGIGVFRKSGGKSSASDPLYFVLKKAVKIKADPNILPPSDTVLAEIKTALEDYFTA